MNQYVLKQQQKNLAYDLLNTNTKQQTKYL